MGQYLCRTGALPDAEVEQCISKLRFALQEQPNITDLAYLSRVFQIPDCTSSAEWKSKLGFQNEQVSAGLGSHECPP